jgi:hypothetical protein
MTTILENRPANPAMMDAVECWAVEAEAGNATALSAVRLGESDTLLVPFTTSMCRVETHYVDSDAHRGYVRCNGEGCLLCRVGRHRDTRDLLPVYDVVARAVAVLPVPPSVRPHALRPQLMPVLRRLKDGDDRLLLSVRKSGYEYKVGTAPLPDDADDGAAAVATFQAAFDAGEIDLASVWPRLDDDTLAGIPEVASAMRAKGVKIR